MLEILRQAVLADEKVLLFSQSLESLSVIEEALKNEPRRGPARASVEAGLDYLRFDGSVDADERDRMIQHFSSPRSSCGSFSSQPRRAARASASRPRRRLRLRRLWNPSQDTQAVFRSYRYGQTRRSTCTASSRRA